MTTDTSTDSTRTDTDSQGTGWFLRASVEQLVDNPADVRGGDRDERALVELAASIRSVGVLQALTVVPDPTADGERRFVIYAGHRRRDGARLAADQLVAEALGHDIASDPTLTGLDVDLAAVGADEVGADVLAAAGRLRSLPCLVRPDLAGEVGMDIAAGLIENGVRDGLTVGQRARAAEQLSLAEGWTVNRIASATGLTRGQARAAAALPRLGDAARAAAYRGELSLEHAAVLDELGADGATDDEITTLARGGPMFEHHVAELRKTLRRRGAAAELRDEADLRGWTLHDEPEGYPLDSTLAPLWSLSRAEDPDRAALLPRAGDDADPTASRTAAAYALLPSHGVVLHNDPWADPHLEVVCADPDAFDYRRDPHSTLYVEPETTDQTCTTSADNAGDEVVLPAPGDEIGQASVDVEADDDQNSPDGVPGTNSSEHDTVAHDDPEHDDGGDDGGEDGAGRGAADADAAAEQARAAREAAEQRRAEAAEQAAREEERRQAAVAEEAARRAAERAAENERVEAERAAAQARRDALETAADTRWRHIAGMLRTQKGAAAHGELPATVLARFPSLLGQIGYLARAHDTALCAEPERDPRTGAQRWSAGRLTHRAVVITAWVLHLNLSAAQLAAPEMLELTEAEPAAWWLDYLTDHGYQPAEAETAAHAALSEAVVDALAAEYGTACNEDGDEGSGVGSDRG